MVTSGFRLTDGRRGGFCWEDKPRCIEGHRLTLRSGLAVTTDVIVRCHHRAGRQDAQACNLRLYVARIPWEPQHTAWLVVEVSDDHVRRMRDAGAQTFLHRLQLLDVVLPGVELDLLADVHPRHTAPTND